jgi:hypothetical protein
MTDHQKLLVAVLSDGADADLSRPVLTAPALMTLLYRLGAEPPRRPVAPVGARA